jgi:hypothetical protein
MPTKGLPGRIPGGQIRKGKKEEEPQEGPEAGIGPKRGKKRRDDTRSVYSEVRIFTVTGLFRFALS